MLSIASQKLLSLICKRVLPSLQICFYSSALPSSFQDSSPLKEFPSDEVATLVNREIIKIPNFITEEEEKSLLSELDPVLKRSRYQTCHWDSAIESFRECERKNWRKDNKVVIDRLRQLTLDVLKTEQRPEDTPTATSLSDLLPMIHCLDLAPEGWIKPHVDSIRYCGGIITVLSLLSDSIARFAIANPSEIAIPTDKLPASCPGIVLPPPGAYADLFIPRRSVYLMRGVSRYRLTHAILPNHTVLPGHGFVDRGRRITVICRVPPENVHPNGQTPSQSYKYGTFSSE